MVTALARRCSARTWSTETWSGRDLVHGGECNVQMRYTIAEAETSPFVEVNNAAWCRSSSPRSARWTAVCERLTAAWAGGAKALHAAIQSGSKDEREPHACEAHLSMASNAGDAFLPVATRMAWAHFLGRPSSWILKDFGWIQITLDCRTLCSCIAVSK